MAFGKHQHVRQAFLWVETTGYRHRDIISIPNSTNSCVKPRLMPFFEELCAPYSHALGRKSILPGVYFCMAIVGYFDAIDS